MAIYTGRIEDLINSSKLKFYENVHKGSMGDLSHS